MTPTARLPILTLLLLLSCFSWQGVQSASKDDYYQLYDFLFGGDFYRKEIRPANNENDTLLVSMNFYLLAIVDVNEKQQMLETSARLEMQWDDDYLEWSSANYSGIEELLVPQKQVYRPDIVLGNSVASQKLMGYDQLPIRLSSIGMISWEPTLLLATDCDIDITYFPFETQLCKIDFETAVSRYYEIDIDIWKDISIVHLDDFTENGQWELVDTSAENLSNEGAKTKVRFSVVIKRRRTFYLLNIILPVFFLSLTASLMFALPADEGEKMGTGITVLLAFAVYLTIVSDLIPNTSLQVSILALYLNILLGLCALSVIICVVNLRIHHRDADKPVGPVTTRFIRISRFLLCINDKDEDPPSRNQVTPSRSRRHEQMELKMVKYKDWIKRPDVNGGGDEYDHVGEDTRKRPQSSRPSEVSGEESLAPMTWQMVAHTMDWLCFILFTLSTLLVTLICLLYLHFGSMAYAPSL